MAVLLAMSSVAWTAVAGLGGALIAGTAAVLQAQFSTRAQLDSLQRQIDADTLRRQHDRQLEALMKLQDTLDFFCRFQRELDDERLRHPVGRGGVLTQEELAQRIDINDALVKLSHLTTEVEKLRTRVGDEVARDLVMDCIAACSRARRADTAADLNAADEDITTTYIAAVERLGQLIRDLS